MELLNILFAILTIAFGVAGWLAPNWTMSKVGLTDTGTTMGTSEIRAASGALFVVVALAALLIGSPTAYAMLGFVWLGGALGRVTSLIVDGSTSRKWTFFGTEIVVGLLLVLGNLWLG